MRRAFGPRTAFEAVFLVAVPVVALAAGLGPYAIVAASAVAYLMVLVLEASLWRDRGAATARRRPERAPRPITAPVAAPVAAAAEPEPEPEVTAEPELQADGGADEEPKREGAHAEQPPEPEPEPVRVLQPVPDPDPDPDPEPEPEPEPEPAPAAAEVVPIGVGAGPRQWNLWDLERLTREASGADALVDEERGFLLMYLREFAGPDGSLPVDFDALVRESFGRLVDAR